ncbi:helix-turn-helix domain-containing protein [Halobacteriales archaeon Cl-PHB]
MSVIADLRIPATEFELGRILELEQGTTLTLEEMIPLGQTAVPFFWVYDGQDGAFEETVRAHPSVTDVTLVESHDDRRLYAINWTIDRDLVFDGIGATDAQLLSATGTTTNWDFELRFPTHEALSDFKDHCESAHISLEVRRVYNPTKPDAGPWFGLTVSQRRTLLRAVEAGYYRIPRGISTAELAEEFDISDQAVTERLRRAIHSLVENTLLLSAETEESDRDRPRR